MTENQVAVQENKQSDKEINFRKIEEKHRRELAEMQVRLEETERKATEALSRNRVEEDDNDDEPYVGHKKLEKKFSSFERRLEEKIDQRAEEKARMLMDRKEEEDWVKNNSDFNEVLREENLMKLVNKAPGLAESIKRMPDGIEKQKLVYNTIKSMGLDKPEQKQSSVQEKIDANRRSPYYQPSGVGAAPYNSVGDYSPAGQKNAYAKMQELKSKLRI
ncbi:MAG TPA: hypothetical protein VK462_06945 [Nitrososphaeraceae archaeon]|nr:hypothetical protein [Nitrososphaeraceae archaeon]